MKSAKALDGARGAATNERPGSGATGATGKGGGGRPPRGAKGPATDPDCYFGISPLLIFPETLGRFNVYLRQQSGYVLYAQSGETFSPKHREKLHEFGVEEVYVQCENKHAFEGYIEENLGRILQDDTLPMAERSRVFYETSSGVVKDVYDNGLPRTLDPKHFERLERMVRQSVNFLTLEHSLKAVASLISHDYRTYTHCLHVFVFASVMLADYGLDEEDLVQLGLGAMLHDLGKSRIPDQILNKPGKLDEDERDIINQHPLMGMAMCTKVPLSQDAINCILFHHERMDGSGYPSALAPHDIPLPVRVISVCDVYDAITSDRPYAKGQSPYEALRIMSDHMRKELDTEVLKRFIQMLSGANLV